MKVKEIYNSRLAKLIGYNITLWPFILFTEEPDQDIRCHEYVHVAQIKDHGFFYFYISYLWEYFTGLVKYRDHYDAYINISWELQAYAKQDLFIEKHVEKKQPINTVLLEIFIDFKCKDEILKEFKV